MKDQLIRLGSAHPELRPHIRPVLQYAESKGMGKKAALRNDSILDYLNEWGFEILESLDFTRKLGQDYRLDSAWDTPNTSRTLAGFEMDAGLYFPRNPHIGGKDPYMFEFYVGGDGISLATGMGRIVNIGMEKSQKEIVATIEDIITKEVKEQEQKR